MRFFVYYIDGRKNINKIQNLDLFTCPNINTFITIYTKM
jgi:hypothetical protein